MQRALFRERSTKGKKDPGSQKKKKKNQKKQRKKTKTTKKKKKKNDGRDRGEGKSTNKRPRKLITGMETKIRVYRSVGETQAEHNEGGIVNSNRNGKTEFGGKRKVTVHSVGGRWEAFSLREKF